MTGKIYVASMNMRSIWAELIDKNSIKINVTSAQAKKSMNRIAFSPMTMINGGYKGFWNFESYWQSGKVYEHVSQEITKKWWKELKIPKRRYPKSKGKKVLYCKFDDYNENMDYITSRKKVYVPEYYNLIKNNKVLLYWKKLFNEGKNLTVYDFDGPRGINNEPLCIELTKELLIEKINYEKTPFGHGYIVAATIASIIPDVYV